MNVRLRMEQRRKHEAHKAVLTYKAAGRNHTKEVAGSVPAAAVFGAVASLKKAGVTLQLDAGARALAQTPHFGSRLKAYAARRGVTLC